MTPVMWFAWLLRGDVRQGRAPGDLEGQRDFVAWWLLWGREEYPAVWHWDATQAAVAMQPVPVGDALTCPRLLRRLHASRPDLQDAFRLEDEESLAEYFCWYRVYGPVELAAAPELPAACLAITEAPSRRAPWRDGGVPVPRIAITLAHRSAGAPLHGRAGSAGTAAIVAAWYKKNRRRLAPGPTMRPDLPTRVAVECRRSGGVNLVGFVRGQLGLGEDVRMAAAALEAAGIAYALVNVPAGAAVPQEDHSLEDRLTERLPYDITIYCMSAFDMAVLYLARGAEFFAGQYRIGYWPWELPSFPPVLKDVYTLVDEVWSGSAFTARSHRTQCTKPVFRLPCPVVLPPVTPVARHDIGLDERVFVFVYPFDINSHLARKNPLGLVRAFRQAFPATDPLVALLLRVNGHPDAQAGWAELVAACAADRRISILEGTLDRQTALGIVASADCLVSPHRAEGFGRNIVEAILLGIPVLATAFSGCADFLAPEEGIPYRRVKLREGDYPLGEGLWWAEPCVAEMAHRMRQVRREGENRRRRPCERLARRRAEIAAVYGAAATGKAFAARLRQIARSLSPPS